MKNKVLIIIPAYNESQSIKETICGIQNRQEGFDYMVINDCSTDNTEDILNENGFNYISLPVNLGIGGAVQTGFIYAFKNGYDYAVQVDGDGQHDVSYLNDMLKTMEESDANMVIGSRFITNEGFQSTFMRRVGITYFTWLIRVLTGATVTDPTSGFRLVNREVIEMFAKDYPKDYPEPESVVAILKRGKKVIEVPVVMKERQGGVSSIRLWKSAYYMIKVTLAILIECTRRH